MIINCAEFEILLTDAVDATLHGEQHSAFVAHRDSCANCSQLAADVLSVTSFIERAAVVEPPKELLTRILHEIGNAKPSQDTADAKPGWRAAIRRFFSPVLQPRLAMGMAMTILSVSMLAQVFGLEVRQLRASDLEPTRIWASAENSAHRQWSRFVQNYENIRVVYEIQSRLKEWADQEELNRQSQQKESASPAPTSAEKPSPPGR